MLIARFTPLLYRHTATLLLWLLLCYLNGCTLVINKASNSLAEGLSSAVLDSKDPTTIEQGLPAYLILLDGLLVKNPDNADMLRAAADLNSAYAITFAKNEDQQQLLADKAFDYAKQSACIESKALCQPQIRPYQELLEQIETLDDKQLPSLYSLGATWASWIEAHSDNWNAIADISRVQAIMNRVVEIGESYQQGGAHLYLGVLASLIPPASGGKPEVGQAHFEQALAISKDRLLMAKVLYAKYYARMMFERELHDRLLEEVIQADPESEGLTLMNVMAQKQARELLESANDYF